MVERLMPKFRWGSVSPTPIGRVRRGTSYQFYKIVPNDVMEVSAGQGLELELEAGRIDQALANYWEAVELLAQEKVDVIVMSGVPVSANLGRPKTLELLRETEQKTGIRATSDLEAVIAAMQHLGVRRVTVGSRWADGLNQAVKQYLQDGGIEVLSMTARGQTPAVALRMGFEEGLQVSLDLGREAAKLAPNADGILVPGGAAMSLHVIPTLEEEFSKPAFTNLNADVWQNLVHQKVIPPIQGWGKLLATP